MDSEKVQFFNFLEALGVDYNKLHAYQKLLLDKAYYDYKKRGNA